MHGINSNKNNSRIAKKWHNRTYERMHKLSKRETLLTVSELSGLFTASAAQIKCSSPLFCNQPPFEKCIIRARHTAPLLYIPNFGLRSHPTSGFGFATSRTDGRNLFLGHHHHNTIAGCDDVPAPQRQKQLFWRALPGCYCTKPIPEQHKKNHHSGRKRVNFNVNLGVDAFLCGVRCESRRDRGRATPPAERCLCHC